MVEIHGVTLSLEFWSKASRLIASEEAPFAEKEAQAALILSLIGFGCRISPRLRPYQFGTGKPASIPEVGSEANDP